MDRLDMPEILHTERLILRRLRYEDAEEIFYAYASKPEATRYLSWATHRTTADTRAFLDHAVKAWANDKDYSYAIIVRANNQLVGSFGLIHELGRVQFGYVISPTYWNRGLATEACRCVMDVLRTKKYLYRVSTFADLDNEASIRVLEKAGLVKEATLQKWFRFVNQEMRPKDCVLLCLPLEGRVPDREQSGIATT